MQLVDCPHVRLAATALFARVGVAIKTRQQQRTNCKMTAYLGRMHLIYINLKLTAFILSDLL